MKLDQSDSKSFPKDSFIFDNIMETEPESYDSSAESGSAPDGHEDGSGKLDSEAEESKSILDSIIDEKEVFYENFHKKRTPRRLQKS